MRSDENEIHHCFVSILFVRFIFGWSENISSLKNCECFNAWHDLLSLHLLLSMNSTWACVCARERMRASQFFYQCFDFISFHFSFSISPPKSHTLCVKLWLTDNSWFEFHSKWFTSKFKVKLNSSSLIANAWNGPITNIHTHTHEYGRAIECIWQNLLALSLFSVSLPADISHHKIA